jgi:hypothetical protein
MPLGWNNWEYINLGPEILRARECYEGQYLGGKMMIRFTLKI